jgi:carbamoylphosphate synthase large subunit
VPSRGEARDPAIRSTAQERDHRRRDAGLVQPTIDYVVTKIPRFTFEKFPQAADRLTTQMKSVGGDGDRTHVQESLRRRC